MVLEGGARASKPEPKSELVAKREAVAGAQAKREAAAHSLAAAVEAGDAVAFAVSINGEAILSSLRLTDERLAFWGAPPGKEEEQCQMKDVRTLELSKERTDANPDGGNNVVLAVAAAPEELAAVEEVISEKDFPSTVLEALDLPVGDVVVLTVSPHAYLS